jgi:hypothetical protein
MRKREAAVAVARRGGGSANEIYGALVEVEVEGEGEGEGRAG